MPPIIDTHAHVFHRGLAFSPGRRYTPDYDAWPQAYLRLLDEHRVTHGVLAPISILGADNAYLLQTLEASGGRLRGLVSLDVKTDIDQVGPLSRRGILGLRINLEGCGAPDLRSQDWRAMLEACRRHDWLVEVNDRAERLQRTVEPLLAVGLKVVLDHFGRPDAQRGVRDPGFAYVLRLGASRQVWVKLSGAYRLGAGQAAEAARLLRGAYGVDRLTWGSDWPFTGFERMGLDYTRTLAALQTWLPDSAEQQQVLGATPAALFGFSEVAA
jgi:predicted TIM-barrel fold metal-dependent hydrolase